jgi:dihydroxyacetone kinase-like protein
MALSITYDRVVDWINRFASEISESKSYLTKLDSAIGDGDHGTNMDRGMKKALDKLGAVEGDDIGRALKAVGMALVSSVGGAGGPLYGTLFLQMGGSLAGKSELSLRDWTDGLEAAVKGVQARGKAEPGDKTMIDALQPALDALKIGAAENGDIRDALEESANAAEQGMKSTVDMVARKGRASYLGERSAGHQDPGATSSYMLIKAAADVLGN